MTTYFPFNYNPNSVSIKTASYTIPAGFYARVTPTNLETDFEIDSVIAVEATKYAASFAGSGSGTKFTNTTTYNLVGSFQNKADTTLCEIRSSVSGGEAKSPYTGNLMTTSASAVVMEAFLAPDDLLHSDNGTGTGYYNFGAESPPVGVPFWVPTGTDLDGTRYMVELFAIP